MKCKVSVIIPVYNSEKYLKRVILSLKEQTLNEMEFIFVDDCSTDNSLNILYEFEKIDPERVLVIKLDENLGPGGARNAALQYYGHNLFFEEQAKKDKVKAAFLMNCYDRNKAKRLIDAISV